MQTSDQSSDEQASQDSSAQFESEETETALAEQSREEVSPEQPRLATKSVPEAVRDEDILTGQVYPPPPSFYLKVQPAPKKVQPVAEAVGQAPMPPYAYGTYGGRSAGEKLSSVPETRYSTGMQLPSPFHPAYQPAIKKSYTWVWILVCTLIVVVLGSCGLIIGLTVSILGPAISNSTGVATDGQKLASDYFTAVQSKDYKRAYSYLSPQGSIAGLTLDQFTARAQQKDQQAGPIQNFTIDPSKIGYTYTADNTVASFSMFVDISRVHEQPYTVHLTFHQMSKVWKIVDFDNI